MKTQQVLTIPSNTETQLYICTISLNLGGLIDRDGV